MNSDVISSNPPEPEMSSDLPGEPAAPPATSTGSDSDANHNLRVLAAYHAHQPRWVDRTVFCTCGLNWGDFCPVLAQELADLGHHPHPPRSNTPPTTRTGAPGPPASADPAAGRTTP